MDALDGAKKPCMAPDTPDGPTVVVVDLAHQEPPSPGAAFGRRVPAILPGAGWPSRNTTTPGDEEQELSSETVISGQNSQRYRESEASCGESAVFYRSDGDPGWAGTPGDRQGPPGTLSGTPRGSFFEKMDPTTPKPMKSRYS